MTWLCSAKLGLSNHFNVGIESSMRSNYDWIRSLFDSAHRHI